MTKRATARSAAMAGLVAALLGGCAQQQGSTSSTVYATPEAPTPAAGAVVAGPPAPAGRGAGFNIQDVTFLQLMIPHHEQAIQMATTALARSTDSGVRQVAEIVQTVQLGEVQQMSDWLFSLGIQPPLGGTAGAHSHGGGMTQQDVDDLATLSGADLDKRFAALMTRHSIGAIELARQETQTGANTGATRLAADIARRESDQVITLEALG